VSDDEHEEGDRCRRNTAQTCHTNPLCDNPADRRIVFPNCETWYFPQHTKLLTDEADRSGDEPEHHQRRERSVFLYAHHPRKTHAEEESDDGTRAAIDQGQPRLPEDSGEYGPRPAGRSNKGRHRSCQRWWTP